MARYFLQNILARYFQNLAKRPSIIDSSFLFYQLWMEGSVVFTYVNAAVNPILNSILTTSNCSPSGITCDIAEYYPEDDDEIDPDGIEGEVGGGVGVIHCEAPALRTGEHFQVRRCVISLTETQPVGLEVKLSKTRLTGSGNGNQELRLSKLTSINHLQVIF